MSCGQAVAIKDYQCGIRMLKITAPQTNRENVFKKFPGVEQQIRNGFRKKKERKKTNPAFKWLIL